jgi:hypothetical protein
MFLYGQKEVTLFGIVVVDKEKEQPYLGVRIMYCTLPGRVHLSAPGQVIDRRGKKAALMRVARARSLCGLSVKICSIITLQVCYQYSIMSNVLLEPPVSNF